MTEWIFSTLFSTDDHIAISLLIHIFVFIDLLIIGECKRHRSSTVKLNYTYFILLEIAAVGIRDDSFNTMNRFYRYIFAA